MGNAENTDPAQQVANKAIVRRYFEEVLDQKRFDVLPELLHPDAVLHRPGFDVVGLDAATTRLRATLADYVAFSTEISGEIAEGDMVCVRLRHRTRVRAHVFRGRAGEVKIDKEQPLDWMAIVQFRLSEGKIAEEWVMRDELGMLLQLGQVTVAPR